MKNHVMHAMPHIISSWIAKIALCSAIACIGKYVPTHVYTACSHRRIAWMPHGRPKPPFRTAAPAPTARTDCPYGHPESPNSCPHARVCPPLEAAVRTMEVAPAPSRSKLPHTPSEATLEAGRRPPPHHRRPHVALPPEPAAACMRLLLPACAALAGRRVLCRPSTPVAPCSAPLMPTPQCSLISSTRNCPWRLGLPILLHARTVGQVTSGLHSPSAWATVHLFLKKKRKSMKRAQRKKGLYGRKKWVEGN